MNLPPGTEARLGFHPAGSTFVFLARPLEHPGMHLLSIRLGSTKALLTHDRDVTWPTPRGVAVAEAMLAAGGTVVLQFESLADALTCHRRLLAEAVSDR